VLAVAGAAIAEHGGASVVYRLKAGDKGKYTAEEVAVKPGRKLGDLREISGPLKAGDKLISAPPASLKNGARVNIGTP
jgi:HlyD family secretion protein